MSRRRSKQWIRRVKLLHWVYILIFAGFGWVLLLGDYGLIKIIRARRLEDAMKKELVELKIEKEILLRYCERLENDRFLLETIAREELGMIRHGERCYRLVE
jgi:cell division protein FtsB